MSLFKGEYMLEYREFPLKKALSFLGIAPFFAFEARYIYALTTGTLFGGLSQGNHLYLLGIGVVAAILTLVMIAGMLDRVRNPIIVMFGSSLLAPIIFLLKYLVSIPAVQQSTYTIVCVVVLFMSFVFTMASTTVFMNQTVVIRYRGRIVGIILMTMLLILFGYNIAELEGYSIMGDGTPIAVIVAIIGIIFTAAFKPWKWDRHPLAVAEEPKRFVTPTIFVLIAYMLWYFSTEFNINNIFTIVGETFPGLGAFSGLTVYEPVLLAIGGINAGLVSDLKGRKVALNSLVLLIGLLAIFSSTFYGLERNEIAPGVYETTAFLNAVPLLIFERFIEGFMLTLLVMLIWSEVGSPKTRTRRLGAIWLVLLLYMAVFWGVELGVFGLQIPQVVGIYGREIAILLSLVASYTTSNVPKIITREVEVEELELNFDDELIEDTIGAFVGADEFESIQSQLELAGTKIETPDGPIDIMTEDFNKILPFSGIPGVGGMLEKKLRKAGYKSAAQLAGETPERLMSKVPGLGEARAKKILRATRRRVKEILRKYER